MKGKNIFTTNEVKEIVALIRKRCSADRSEQKQIRAKMRRIGFYGKDDFGIFDMKEEKFYGLIESGEINISDRGAATGPSIQTKREKNLVPPSNLKSG